MSNAYSPGSVLAPFPFASDPGMTHDFLACRAPSSLRQMHWTDIASGWLPVTHAVAEPDLSFLFRMCLNPKRGLDQQSYRTAASLLGAEVAAIQAVAEVETAGNAFDAEGRPVILFERHYFHRLTHGRYDRRHPDISSPHGGGYGKFSAQYGKLEKAYGLDPAAALQSASWGRFQVMGNNFRAAGFGSVRWLVLALTRSEASHLMAFANFVRSGKAMHEALKKKDWATFAKHYNGKNYEQNNYSSKLELAYRRLAAP